MCKLFMVEHRCHRLGSSFPLQMRCRTVVDSSVAGRFRAKRSSSSFCLFLRLGFFIREVRIILVFLDEKVKQYLGKRFSRIYSINDGVEKGLIWPEVGDCGQDFPEQDKAIMHYYYFLAAHVGLNV